MTHPKHPPAAEQGASTGSRAASAREREISAEQEVVDRAYRELDRRLESARASLAATQASPTGGTHQSRGERDAYAAHYAGLVASLEGVEDRLVFGRMDLAPDAAGAGGAGAGGRHYVGRAGLQDSRRREVVLDWRAPLARAFYQATASNPMGLVRRRHIDTRRRRVIGLEDEVVDVRSLREGGPAGARAAAEGLQGEGALIAAMSAARHGRMGDIVATIQAEQDRVVTSGTRGVLVVQGGPGTGKTAVALHRVAYLFYSERTRLERSGVLLVGPSRTFLRYVEQVLPSLGETGVVSTTIADLVPGVRARGVEDPRVHEIKGRALWAEVLRRAVRGLQRVPDGPRPIVVEGTALELRPADVREAVNRARRSGRPHNLARETFVLWLLERLTDQFAALTGQDASDPDTRAWIREDIRTARDARREINLCWMPTTPAGLLERLWARPALLAELAPELTGDERALLARPAGGEPTPADVPLLDELAELLGPSEDAQARRARLEARRRADLVSYAAQAIESQGLGGGMVSAEMLADRMADSGPALTLAERARADRTWTYGHVVVDEAQELGAMAWRALARRCPVRSFTVVGDLAQYSGPRAPASWGEALAALGTRPGGAGASGTGGAAGRDGRGGNGPAGRARGGGRRGARDAGGVTLNEEVLTVCYRTPSTIMRVADEVAAALGRPPVYPVRSVRDLPDCLECVDVSEAPEASDEDAWAILLRRTVARESAALDRAVGASGGRIAVIAPDAATAARHLGEDPALAAAMRAPGGDVLRARLAVMGPVMSKGLEFDAVVLVDPAAIGRRSPGDLYVAMTRPTRRLVVVSRLPLPEPLRRSQRA